MAEQTKKPKPIKPYSAKWMRLASRLALDYAPPIYQCKKCAYPVLTGYCCQFCGTAEPR